MLEQVEYSEKEWNAILRLCKGKHEFKEIYRVMICSCLYNMWHERNLRIFKNKKITIDRLAKDIIRKNRKHLSLAMLTLKDNISLRILYEFLNISPT